MPTKVNQKASSFKLSCGAICPTKISHSFANYVLVLYGDECICRAIWGHHFITLLMLVLCGGNIWGALKDISYKVKFCRVSKWPPLMLYSCCPNYIHLSAMRRNVFWRRIFELIFIKLGNRKVFILCDQA